MKKLEIRSISQGIVLPFSVDNRGGGCFSNGDFIENSKYEGDWLKLGGKYSFDVKNALTIAGKYFFWGDIGDILSRLSWTFVDSLQRTF